MEQKVNANRKSKLAGCPIATAAGLRYDVYAYVG